MVRRQYLASATGDLEAFRATVAPDVEWTETAGFPLGGTYRTPDGVIAGVMEQLATAWDQWVTHDDTYVVDGERVVVLARYSAVNKATGRRCGGVHPDDHGGPKCRVMHRQVPRDGMRVALHGCAGRVRSGALWVRTTGD